MPSRRAESNRAHSIFLQWFPDCRVKQTRHLCANNLKMKHRQAHHRWWLKHLPTQERIVAYRLLKPVRHLLDHDGLWQFNRRSVAAGAAVGLFFSVASPVAQILLAAITAILLKVNLPVAVLGTFFSNPLTTPAILFFAFHLGALLVGHDAPAEDIVAKTHVSSPEAGFLEGVSEWALHSMDWIQSAGWPLVVGLGVLSVLLSGGGYVVVSAAWRIQTALRWRTRHNERQCDKQSQ